MFVITDYSSSLIANFALDPAIACLSDSGTLETLTLPINADLSLQVNGVPRDLNLSGEVIATTAVPEPASVAVLVSSGLLVLRFRR